MILSNWQEIFPICKSILHSLCSIQRNVSVSIFYLREEQSPHPECDQVSAEKEDEEAEGVHLMNASSHL